MTNWLSANPFEGGDLVTIRILYRQPDTMSLWGIPYGMRPGQSPADLHRAGNTRGWIWLGSPGWWGSMSRERQKEVRAFLASVPDIPKDPNAWSEVS